MKIFNHPCLVLVLFGFILKGIKCSLTSKSESAKIVLKEEDDIDSDYSIFEMMKEGQLVPIANKATSVESAKETLAMIILASFITGYHYFKEQLKFVYQEENKYFNDFMGQIILKDAWNGMFGDELKRNENLSLKDFLLNKGVFEFILKRGKYPSVDPILKAVEILAIKLCPEIAKGIHCFLNLFPTLEPLESKEKMLLFSAICKTFIEPTKKTIFLAEEFNLNKKDLKKIKKFLFRCYELGYNGLQLFSPEYLEYNEKDIYYFDKLVHVLLDSRNSDTISFFEDNSSVVSMDYFLTAGKSIFLPKELKVLKTKGLFCLIANEPKNENVQKILKILDYRLRWSLWVSNKFRIDPNYSKLFWASLSTLKDVKEMDRLTLILLRFSFDPHYSCRIACSNENGNDNDPPSCLISSPQLSPKDDGVAFCKNFYSNLENNYVAFIRTVSDTLFDFAALNEWQRTFMGFISPNFLYSDDQAFILRDIGLQKEQLLWNIIGHALYISFFKGKSFSQVFREILSKVPQGTFILKDEFLKISIMDSFIEVYAKLRETANSNPIEFFFQYVTYFKSNAKGDLLRHFFTQIPVELKYPPRLWDRRAESLNLPDSVGKFNSEIADKILKLVAKAYLAEKESGFHSRDYESNANFLLQQDSEVFKFVVKLLRNLDTSFYNPLITAEIMKKSAQNIQLVLENLHPRQQQLTIF
jgi:frataxin-like iron-binding protein CyaY